MLPFFLRLVALLVVVYTGLTTVTAYQSLSQSMKLIGAEMPTVMYMLAGEALFKGLLVAIALFIAAHLLAKREQSYHDFRHGRPRTS